MTRYELRQGKFGYYFYDTEYDKDLSLEEVLELLNLYEDYKTRIFVAETPNEI